MQYMKSNIKSVILSTVIVFVMAILASCEQNIELGRANESGYAATEQLHGMLVDQNTNKNSSVVELRDRVHVVNAAFRLSKLPRKGIEVKVAVDEKYALTYNAVHQTYFIPFPPANVDILNDGYLVLAPDDNMSNIQIKLTAFDAMEEEKTYILPLNVTSLTEGVTLTEEARHMILLIQDHRKKANHDKGQAIQTVLFFEVNDTNPLNALEFITEEGEYFFDHVVLFAANINWDEEKQRVYVHNNPNVQYLLDHNDEYLQPLRKAGIKVIMGILGNHDQSGVAQLSDMGAKEYAREIAAYCRKYNLDGVSFDDEYSKDPDLNNPWLAPHARERAARLCYECKAAMPEKIVSTYNYGYMGPATFPIIDGVEPGQFVDYSVGNYGAPSAPGIGMTMMQCCANSTELRINRGLTSEDQARSMRERGYGFFMFFGLHPPLYETQLPHVLAPAKGLYEKELLPPTHYYEKNSIERKTIRKTKTDI